MDEIWYLSQLGGVDFESKISLEKFLVLYRFEHESTAMAGCLLHVPGSLRANPNNGLLVMGF